VILFALLLLCLIIQLYYILFVHLRLRTFKVEKDVSELRKPVSVIICARNEAENLKKNIPLILEQDYPNYEVVLVNDRSWDDSELILKELSLKYKHLKIVTITEQEHFRYGKKFAVTLGIKAASNELLLFTDADCCPSSQNWLMRMQANFTEETEIVLGYSPYTKSAGFLNMLIRFETFNTALNYLSFALIQNPYMGVGRNMAYRKSLFFQSKGFASHFHIPSGDDDLFVNENANKTNTRIEIHPETHMLSEPKRTFSAYLKQKIRHQGAGKAYKSKHKFSLSLLIGSALGFYIFLGLLAALQADWRILLAAYLFRLFVQVFVYYPIFKKLKYKDLIFWFPAFDLIYFFSILALNIITLFKRKVSWR
jgi:glycosyltransferase involved in cell wall biosynthesis